MASCTAFAASAVTSGGTPASETSSGSCLYIFAVYCDPTVPGSSACAYVASAQTDGSTAPPRLLDGEPVSVSLVASSYKYFTIVAPAGAVSITLSATVSTGQPQLLLARRVATVSANGTQTLSLPTFASPSSFLASSNTVPPSIVWAQVDPPAPPPASNWLANTTSSAAPPTSVYTVGVYAGPGGQASELTLRAFWFSGPIILVPNQIMPFVRIDAGRPAILYEIRVVDPTADLVISVTFLNSPVSIALGSRSSVPSCAPGAGRSGLSCTGATWVATPAAGAYSVTLTVPARAPCTGAVSPSTCVPALDYAPGSYIIAVQAWGGTVRADFSITAYLSNIALTLVAGQPQSIAQAAGGSTQVRQMVGGGQVLWGR